MNPKKSSANGSQLVSKRPYNEVEAREVVAREEHCLLNKAYVQAQIILGKDWQNVLDASEDVLRQACTHCHQQTAEERQVAA